MSELVAADLSLYTEPADMVIAGLMVRGRPVTRTQLARWHQAGYVPEPIQRHQAGVRGSVSWYPAGTRAQLQAFCALHTRERNLPEVAWRMWWARYPVPIDHARIQLRQVVTLWQGEIAKARDLLAASATSAEGEAELDRLLMAAAKGRTTRKVARQARQRLGRERFMTFVRILLQVATGTFEGFAVDPVTWTDEDERQLVEAGLGLQRARTDRLLDVPPWLPNGIGDTLTWLSRQLREHPLGEDLDRATEAELASARDEVRLFLALFESFSTMAERIFGRYAFGFGTLARAIREMTPQDQAWFLVVWRTLRTWGLGANMDMAVATARQCAKVWQPAYVALQQLAAAVPEAAVVVSPKRVRKALKSRATQAQWQETLRLLYEQHKEKFDAFWAQHPEMRHLFSGADSPAESAPIDEATTDE
jgi:hypothetical protein